MTPEQIAKLIEQNRSEIGYLSASASHYIEHVQNKVLLNIPYEDLGKLMGIFARQQQLIEYLLKRENERTGDGK